MINRFSMACEYKPASHYAVTTTDAIGERRVLFGPFKTVAAVREVIANDVRKVVPTIVGLEDSLERVRIEETQRPIRGDFNELLDARSQLLLRAHSEPPLPEGVVRATYNGKGFQTFIVGQPGEIAHHLSLQKGFYPITTAIPQENDVSMWINEKKDAIVRIKGLSESDVVQMNNVFKSFKDLSPELRQPLAGTVVRQEQPIISP